MSRPNNFRNANIKAPSRPVQVDGRSFLFTAERVEKSSCKLNPVAFSVNASIYQFIEFIVTHDGGLRMRL
jgi:hypothetical protein